MNYLSGQMNDPMMTGNMISSLDELAGANGWGWTMAATEVTTCAYRNAATCPECDGGMVRQGGCCSCPSCGFSSCGI